LCDAFDSDDDNDTMPDKFELASACGLNPLANDADLDADADMLANAGEYGLGTNICVADTDGDGCRDGAEVQNAPGSERTGGRRDPLYFWDFYDVWTHPPNQPTGWTRDKVISSAGDLLGLGARYGPGPHPPSGQQAVALALATPVANNGYHIAFDRAAATGPEPWDRGPPDGVINIATDLLGMAAQYGHNCS
jgi:hypothetical protein